MKAHEFDFEGPSDLLRMHEYRRHAEKMYNSPVVNPNYATQSNNYLPPDAKK